MIGKSNTIQYPKGTGVTNYGTEAKVQPLEKQKAHLEYQNYLSDIKSIIFDIMMTLQKRNIKLISEKTLRTIREYTAARKETISFGCGLFGIGKQVHYGRIRRFKKKRIADQEWKWFTESLR